MRAPFSLTPGTQRLQVQARGQGGLRGRDQLGPTILPSDAPVSQGTEILLSLAKSTSQEKMKVLLSLGKAPPMFFT